MKRIVILLLLLFLLPGCQKEVERVNPTYLEMPSAYKADMSEYLNLKAFDHQFIGVSVEEVFNALENKGSGVFYLGYETCPWCNSILSYVNEVARECDVNIFYINVYADEPDFLGYYDKFLDTFGEYLDENDRGEKALFTPLFIFILNGEIVNIETGIPSDWEITGNSEKQIERVKDSFRKKFAKFEVIHVNS